MLRFTAYLENAELHHSLVLRYKPVIDEFLSTHPIPTDDKNCASCGIVAGQLVKFLKSKRIPAMMIGAYGLKSQLGDDPHPDYADEDRPHMYHLVVKTSDVVIDLVGRQFGKRYGGARILTLQDFAKDWKKVNWADDLPEN